MKCFLHNCGVLVFACAMVVSSTVISPVARAAPPPGVSGALSIVPGLGQVANGDTLEGIGWFSAVIFPFFLSRSPTIQQVSFDLWFYNMYDAFRDAGGAETTNYTWYENYIATFNPLNLIDPIGPPILAYQAWAVTHSSVDPNQPRVGPRNPIFTPFAMGVVGLGEEGLFRGFLYPGFSYLTTSHALGAVISSALFSAAHLIDGSSYSGSGGVLLFRFVSGLLFCWQTSINKFDLRHSIFTHAWFDVMAAWKQNGVIEVPGFGQSPQTAAGGGNGLDGATLRLNLQF